jgi:hypothetical protein
MIVVQSFAIYTWRVNPGWWRFWASDGMALIAVISVFVRRPSRFVSDQAISR